MDPKQTKILIVEDDITMREIVVHKLTTSGFDVVEAGDGPTAIETWKKEKPDLVLLDLMLPEMDGFQILESIKKSNPELGKTSVIILSNLFSKEDMQKAKSLGITDFMVKAYYTTEDILTKVNEAIGKN
jgi:CheY-like chemotaxis protein